jgi:hypothetical protein
LKLTISIYFEKNIIIYENSLYKRAFNFVLQYSSWNFRISSEKVKEGFIIFFRFM